VLAFSDESLARLAIAATSVPHEQRRQWLRKVAREVDAERRRKSDAHRQALARQRRRDGERVYRVAAHDDVIEALIRAGRLDERTALDHYAVEQAIGEVVAVWSQKWLR